MKTRDHSATIAISASLLVHGAFLYSMSQSAIRQYSLSLYHSPLRVEPSAISHSRVIVDEPAPAKANKPKTPLLVDDPMPQPSPKPAIGLLEPPPPPPPSAMATRSQPIKPVEVAPSEDIPPAVAEGFGEFTGSPNASGLHSVEGDMPMQAHKAEQDQPFISRDPVGRGNPMDKPADKDHAEKDKPGDKGQSGNAHTGIDESKPASPSPVEAMKPVPKQPPLQPEPAPPEPAQPVQVAMGGIPAIRETPVPGPNAESPKQSPVSPPALPVDRTPKAQAAAARVDAVKNPAGAEKVAVVAADQAKPNTTPGGKAGSPSAGASAAANPDPAPMTDSESDPFSMVGSAEFRPGKTVARFGRKVTTVRPRLSLAGQYDLLSLPSPAVILRVRADETGRVREVKVAKSSGSNEVDQPCLLAMYEWWFEPPRDKNGKPLPSEMLWTMTWQVR